ncbi:hypothetical protein HZH68_013985 [Vespula germanica]|uniref:Uncharacterized protein n=1 Tax=Vespula germanica TaxID=30212 RepID=A0A834JCL7_VESGE|nr:hypothetical protein HZH68_013985 [Vespula germanica]
MLKRSKVIYNDPNIEYVHRVHQNNFKMILKVFCFIMIYIWLIIGVVGWSFRNFVVSIIIHTFAYIIFSQEPERFLSFFFGSFIAIYNTLMSLLHTVLID